MNPSSVALESVLLPMSLYCSIKSWLVPKNSKFMSVQIQSQFPPRVSASSEAVVSCSTLSVCFQHLTLSSLTLSGVVEVYRVTKRVELGIKATAVCSEKLQQLLKDIDKVWNNLIGFMSLATLTVSPLDNLAVAFLLEI